MKIESAREIQDKITLIESQLELMRAASQVTPARLDGLPRAKSFDSRVEAVAQKIVDAEAELGRLRAELYVVAQELTIDIVTKIGGLKAQVLVRRYALLQDFRTIAKEIYLSEARTYAIHKEALAKYNACTA